MGRKLLKISYLGTNYCGWQVQPNGVTVQATLQEALLKLLSYKPNVTGCSRTDSGVHAKEFYCHFDCENNISNIGIVLGLNTILPSDIVAIDCKSVDDDFHARYNAKGKEYVYQIYTGRIPDPFLEGRSYNYKYDINLKKAEEFCNLIIGKHDFSAFSSIHRSVKDTVRTIFDCKILKQENKYTFVVSGDGFLYNMVRILVGTMLEYSLGKISKDDILLAFENGNRKLLGKTLSPEGLYLNKVIY